MDKNTTKRRKLNIFTFTRVYEKKQKKYLRYPSTINEKTKDLTATFKFKSKMNERKK